MAGASSTREAVRDEAWLLVGDVDLAQGRCRVLARECASVLSRSAVVVGATRGRMDPGAGIADPCSPMFLRRSFARVSGERRRRLSDSQTIERRTFGWPTDEARHLESRT
jgi:hypothetical protein